MNSVEVFGLSLRQLRAVLQAAETGSISRASELLARSQSATSKAISQVEKQLGVKLFDRITAGLVLTSYGEVLVNRLKSAYREFESAGAAYRNLLNRPIKDRIPPLFRMEVSNQRLVAFLTVHRCRNVRRAAERLNITSHAVYGSLHELQDQLDMPLFERSTGGILDATPYSRVLFEHVRLAFSEIQHAIDEMSGMEQGVVQGRVALATLPAMRNLVVPRAINSLLESHPRIQVVNLEGDMESLISSLRSGELDFVIGVRNRTLDHPDLDLHYLMNAETRILARSGHPLSRLASVSASDLADAKWVLPPADTIVAEWFQSYFRERGFRPPGDYVVSISSQVTDGILLESDRLAISSVYDVQRRAEHASLVALAADDIQEYSRKNLVKLHVMTRAQTTLSPPARLFLEKLTSVIRDLERAEAGAASLPARRDERIRRVK